MGEAGTLLTASAHYRAKLFILAKSTDEGFCFCLLHFAFVFPQLGADSRSPPRRQQPEGSGFGSSTLRLRAGVCEGVQRWTCYLPPERTSNR